MNAWTQVIATLGAVPFWAHWEGPTPASGPRNWTELFHAWSWEPLLVFGLLVSGGLYRRGARRLRERVGPGRGLRRWEVACFWAGWWTLVVALLSPLHAWGGVLFSAHMTQHELLMVVAAPLLVLGRPMVGWLFALPTPEACQISRVARAPEFKRIWRVLSDPLGAWGLHAVALWAWHIPLLFAAAVAQPWIHDLQHLSFLGSALIFWWALMRGGAGVRGFGAAVLYLFTTMMHTGLLGALITFATTPWYVTRNQASMAWSLTPLEDQQLGGLIMWVPAGLVYLVAALALLAGWLRASGRRADASGTLTQAGAPLLLLAVCLLTGCSGEREREAARLTGGWPGKGRQEIQRAGCAACHTIPGIPGADRLVGPSLRGIASRDYIGGVLPNTPENMVQWLLDPPAHSPKTVMPRLDLNEQQARDIAAYLYTLTRP